MGVLVFETHIQPARAGRDPLLSFGAGDST